jgi:hypothetical protein
MAKCDLCGADCRATELETLLDSYQLPNVRDVCPDCRRWANKLKADMLDEIGPRMRAAITERKGLPAAPQPVAFWRRSLRAVARAFSA